MRKFINGWHRTEVGDKYFWECPYCTLKLVTHLDDVHHGCRLKEYGPGDLLASGLKKIGVTKQRVTNLLRTITGKPKIKCKCGFRLALLNSVGRFLKINYFMTWWKRGASPRAFATRRRYPPPENSGGPVKGPGFAQAARQTAKGGPTPPSA